MKRMVRTLLWLVIALLVIATGLVATLFFQGGGAIKSAVNNFGPSMLGVPVTLEDAELHPLRGHARLRGLHIGNPAGFQTPGLFDVSDVLVELDTLSLFGGTLHIRRIFIDAPRFTYERGEEGSNLDRVLEKLGAKKGKSPTPGPGETTNAPVPPPQTKPGKAEKKIIIDELTISNAAVRAHLPVVGELPAIAIGSIVVRDVGKAEDGVTFQEALKSISKQVAAAIDQNVDAVAKSLRQGVKQIEQQAKPLIDALRGIFGKEKKKKDGN